MADAKRARVLDKIQMELGIEGRQIAQILYDSEKLLTVEEIDEKLSEIEEKEVDIKEIRQILYTFSDNGYARSRRYRDSETGWISFLWNLFPDKILK